MENEINDTDNFGQPVHCYDSVHNPITNWSHSIYSLVGYPPYGNYIYVNLTDAITKVLEMIQTLGTNEDKCQYGDSNKQGRPTANNWKTNLIAVMENIHPEYCRDEKEIISLQGAKYAIRLKRVTL